MPRLSDELSHVLDALDGDAAKFLAIARNNERFRNAVRSVWVEEAAARMILEHVNAFYVRKRERRGMAAGTAEVVCEICVDDPVIRSELDTHRELLHLALVSQDLAFQDISIVSARGTMRERHPFIEDGEARGCPSAT